MNTLQLREQLQHLKMSWCSHPKQVALISCQRFFGSGQDKNSRVIFLALKINALAFFKLVTYSNWDNNPNLSKGNSFAEPIFSVLITSLSNSLNLQPTSSLKLLHLFTWILLVFLLLDWSKHYFQIFVFVYYLSNL